MHNAIIFDFETRSRCPIKTAGLARYATDPSTEVLCAAWIRPGETEPLLWSPGNSIPDVHKYVIYAWNAQFEKAIWENVLHWPQPAGWYDIAAHARACGVPGSLENASIWFGLGEAGKDSEGKKLINDLCQPIKTGKKKGEWREKSEFPDLYDKLYKYCQQDCRAEQTILNLLPPWPESEQAIWRLTMAQNERGCPIDIKLCESVVALTDQFLERAKTTICEATENAIVSPTQAVALKKWLNEQGINIDDVGKATIDTLLKTNDLPPKVIDVLKARQLGAPASIKKFKTALAKEVTGRLYHNFYYAGAGATARWSGTSEDSSSVQLQNLFRGEQTEEMLDIIKLADADILTAFSDAPMKELQKSTRSMLCAQDDNVFIYTDASAIEARFLRWLARSPALNDFANYDKGGPDPYKAEAAKTFNKKIEAISSDDRQCGKVLVLSAQYGCGWQKFQATVNSWTGGKVQLTDTFAQATINAFRKANPEITKYWRDLEKAFTKVLTGELTTVRVGCCEFSQPYNRVVAIKLPSGRSMYYNRCKIVNKEICYTKHDGMVTKFYGGHGAENICQAVSRDFIAEAMLTCEAKGLSVVHHAHDSILVECNKADAEAKGEVLRSIMTTPPVWAATIPLAAPIKIVRRMP